MLSHVTKQNVEQVNIAAANQRITFLLCKFAWKHKKCAL